MTHKKPTPISEEDKALFRQAIGDIHPIKTTPTALRPKRNPAKNPATPAKPESPEPPQYSIDHGVPLVTGSDRLCFRRSGVQEQRLRKLRQQRVPMAAHLDLHGMTLQAAEQRTRCFLATAQQRGQRCVRIVHGKGLHGSERYPRLKNHIHRLLRAAPQVLAFCSAPPQEGGTGVVYVLIALKPF